ncbi:MAG: site-specific DNA-methyltransferase [Gammaproteobacteria bacterium]|nr:site-specific DNA-methyltransferase [Gammaproteobacteria bacterium]
MAKTKQAPAPDATTKGLLEQIGRLEIEQLPIDAVKPYEKNPRIHKPSQVRKIRRSMEAMGWTIPILIDGDGEIIAGHGRHLAAKDLGLKTVPVIRRSDLTEEQVIAYRIADNKLTEESTWDEELLADQLKRIDTSGLDVELTGFDLSDVNRPLLKDEDAPAPEPEPGEPTTRPGDLWLLGDHRLLCGDATDPDTDARLFAGEKPFLMVTDPPYGVNYDPSWREERGLGEPTRKDKVPNDHNADWSAVYRRTPAAVLYVWHAAYMTDVVAAGLKDHGFDIRAQIIWCKTNPVISRGAYNWQHECLVYAEAHTSCHYAVRNDESARWIGGVSESTVWNIKADRGDDTTHGTQKPVECMERPIRNHKGDVYDPFLGSGTTLLAAHNQGRTCYATEISPAFVDTAIRRYLALTGELARNEKTGKEFPI